MKKKKKKKWKKETGRRVKAKEVNNKRERENSTDRALSSPDGLTDQRAKRWGCMLKKKCLSVVGVGNKKKERKREREVRRRGESR